MSEQPTILFLCPHNAAKSVIAATFFNQMAPIRGLPYRAASAGTEPDAAVMESVVNYMRGGGVDLSDYEPRAVTAEDLANAAWVVSMGCDLSDLPPTDHDLDDWDDVPDIGQGVDAAVDVILRHLRELMEELGG